MASTSYPVPPPTYTDASSSQPKQSSAEAAPLLGGGNSYFDQPEEGDLPDDFKYGTTVSESAPEIRRAFVRKVYTILFCQILGTTLVGGFMMNSPSTVFWVQTHSYVSILLFVFTMINLGVLFWKRHSHPANLIFLSTFTLLEAFAVGLIVTFYDQFIVLQALFLTLGVFIGLTLFTLQSKYDFEGMGPWLFGLLWAFVITGFVGVFVPFGKTMDLIYALFGCLLFSGYVIYDTSIITNKLSPDEWVLGSLSLYLDFINLFISILRLLNNAENR